MLVEVGPKSKTVEAINELAQLISRRDPPPVQKTSLLSSLLKRK
jgi:pilus assembly protein CpaE